MSKQASTTVGGAFQIPSNNCNCKVFTARHEEHAYEDPKPPFPYNPQPLTQNPSLFCPLTRKDNAHATRTFVGRERGAGPAGLLPRRWNNYVPTTCAINMNNEHNVSGTQSKNETALDIALAVKRQIQQAILPSPGHPPIPMPILLQILGEHPTSLLATRGGKYLPLPLPFV